MKKLFFCASFLIQDVLTLSPNSKQRLKSFQWHQSRYLRNWLIIISLMITFVHTLCHVYSSIPQKVPGPEPCPADEKSQAVSAQKMTPSLSSPPVCKARSRRLKHDSGESASSSQNTSTAPEPSPSPSSTQTLPDSTHTGGSARVVVFIDQLSAVTV